MWPRVLNYVSLWTICVLLLTFSEHYVRRPGGTQTRTPMRTNRRRRRSKSWAATVPAIGLASASRLRMPLWNPAGRPSGGDRASPVLSTASFVTRAVAMTTVTWRALGLSAAGPCCLWILEGSSGGAPPSRARKEVSGERHMWRGMRELSGVTFLPPVFFFFFCQQCFKLSLTDTMCMNHNLIQS